MTSNEVVHCNVEQPPSDKIGRVRKETHISSESSDSQEEDANQPRHCSWKILFHIVCYATFRCMY